MTRVRNKLLKRHPLAGYPARGESRYVFISQISVVHFPNFPCFVPTSYLYSSMFCDSKMLGWGTGSIGLAAQVPESYEPGMPPPKSKPGAPPKSEEATIPAAEVQGLFEKKLTKEEKKKLAEEKRKARKAAKEAKKMDGES